MEVGITFYKLQQVSAETEGVSVWLEWGMNSKMATADYNLENRRFNKLVASHESWELFEKLAFHYWIV